MEDRDIIRQVKEGNADAFAILVEKYHRRLLNFIFRLIKDEAIVEDIGRKFFFVFINHLRTLMRAGGPRFQPGYLLLQETGA